MIHRPPQVNKNEILGILVKEVNQLKKEINDIKDGKIIDILQIPTEQSEEDHILKKAYKLDKIHRCRPLLESEIEEAQSKNFHAIEAAKYLEVNYRTYKKWCLIYKKWKTNPWGKGMKRKWDSSKGKYLLNQILEGKFPNYPLHRLKDLLIRSQIKEAKCEICEFNEKRFTDHKMPLLVNFRDGNEHNHKIENLQILCYNHYFTVGRGWIRHGKVKFDFLDPDYIQRASRKIDSQF
jgi:hypothetical protein